LVVDDKAKFEAALKTLEGFRTTVNGLDKQQKEKY
jgi:hypothetical protein